jgi:TonB family protein
METVKSPHRTTRVLQVECWSQGRCIESTVLFKGTPPYRARPRHEDCLFEIQHVKKGYRFNRLSSDLGHAFQTTQFYAGDELISRVILHLGREWRFQWVELPSSELSPRSPQVDATQLQERLNLKKSIRESLLGFGLMILVSGLFHHFEEKRKEENPELISPEVARLILKPIKRQESAQRAGGSPGSGPKSAAEMKQTLQSQEIKAAFAQLTSKAALAKTLGNSNQFLSQWKSNSGFKNLKAGTAGLSELTQSLNRSIASAGQNLGRGGAGTVGGGDNGYGTSSGSGPAVQGQGSGKVAFETRFAKVEEGLTADEVGEVILRHAAEIRYCYEDALLRNPSVEGQLQLLFKISPRGRVSSTQIKSSTLGEARLEDCVIRKLSSWAFPQPKGGIEVPVTYPFVFKNLDRNTHARKQ